MRQVSLQIMGFCFYKLLSSHAAVNVGKALFPLFALALELPETYFDDKVSLDLCNYSYFSRKLVVSRRGIPQQS